MPGPEENNKQQPAVPVAEPLQTSKTPDELDQNVRVIRLSDIEAASGSEIIEVFSTKDGTNVEVRSEIQVILADDLGSLSTEKIQERAQQARKLLQQLAHEKAEANAESGRIITQFENFGKRLNTNGQQRIRIDPINAGAVSVSDDFDLSYNIIINAAEKTNAKIRNLEFESGTLIAFEKRCQFFLRGELAYKRALKITEMEPLKVQHEKDIEKSSKALEARLASLAQEIRLQVEEEKLPPKEKTTVKWDKRGRHVVTYDGFKELLKADGKLVPEFYTQFEREEWRLKGELEEWKKTQNDLDKLYEARVKLGDIAPEPVLPKPVIQKIETPEDIAKKAKLIEELKIKNLIKEEIIIRQVYDEIDGRAQLGQDLSDAELEKFFALGEQLESIQKELQPYDKNQVIGYREELDKNFRIENEKLTLDIHNRQKAIDNKNARITVLNNKINDAQQKRERTDKFVSEIKEIELDLKKFEKDKNELITRREVLRQKPPIANLPEDIILLANKPKNTTVYTGLTLVNRQNIVLVYDQTKELGGIFQYHTKNTYQRARTFYYTHPIQLHPMSLAISADRLALTLNTLRYLVGGADTIVVNSSQYLENAFSSIDCADRWIPVTDLRQANQNTTIIIRQGLEGINMVLAAPIEVDKTAYKNWQNFKDRKVVSFLDLTENKTWAYHAFMNLDFVKGVQYLSQEDPKLKHDTNLHYKPKAQAGNKLTDDDIRIKLFELGYLTPIKVDPVIVSEPAKTALAGVTK